MLSADQMRGKIVVFAGGVRFRPPTTFTSATNEAAAIVRVAGARIPANTLRSSTWPTANMLMRSGNPQEGPLTISVTDRSAEAMLGMPVAQATLGMAGKTVRGAIVFAESPAPARNVVAIVRGTDSKLRNTYVAMGAHADHLGISPESVDHDSLHLYNEAEFAILGLLNRGQRPTPEQVARVDSIRINLDSVRRIRPPRLDSIRNGADDDGSGSMTLLEIAESFAKGPKPKRSLIFIWHTGEEKGLLGSRWFADHMTVPLDSVIAQLNMDMIGRGEAKDRPTGSANYLELVGSRRLSTELGDWVVDVNKNQKQPFTIDYTYDAPGHPENIYCRSDHFHYARRGIPVTFFTTGQHGDYHQVSDEPQYINYEHLARVGQLVHDVALRVGNAKQRPVVDGQKMDPNGVCRQ
jgi:peptidase M28-like protein